MSELNRNNTRRCAEGSQAHRWLAIETKPASYRTIDVVTKPVTRARVQ